MAGVALVSLVVGASMAWPIGRVDQARREDDRADMRAASVRGRTFRPAWRSAWWPPLAVSFLFVAHWGVVTGYLPQRAEPAGADIALFFTADAASLVDRAHPGGAARGARRLAALDAHRHRHDRRSACCSCCHRRRHRCSSRPASGPASGAAFLLPPVNFELARRSTDAIRGSAFALFSFAFSAGVALGSIGISPIFGTVGFEVALAFGIGLCLLGGVVVLVDPWLRGRPPLPPMPTEGSLPIGLSAAG